MKICLDAGHSGRENRSPADGRYYESEMAWKLQCYLKTALEARGFQVVVTRQSLEQTLAVVARGRLARGCSLFLSLHSNAAGGGVVESVDRPEVIYPISGACSDLALQLANTIAGVMGTRQPGKVYSRVNSAGRADYYGVIRGAAAVGVPGLILEHSFHTATAPTHWLLQEENLRRLADAEAAVLGDYYKIGKEADTMPTQAELEALIDRRVGKAVQTALRSLLLEQSSKAGSDWSEAARRYCIEQGLIAGTGTDQAGTPAYAWQSPLTREQMAVILYRLCQKQAEKGPGSCTSPMNDM